MLTRGGRALKRLGGTPAYQTLSNSEYHGAKPGSQAVGDKLHSREENSPDHRLRPQRHHSVEHKEVILHRQ